MTFPFIPGAIIVGFQVMGNWVHIKGLEVTGIQVTFLTHTESYCFYSWGSNNIFELLKLHDNMAVRVRHRGNGVNNLFLNCDSHRSYDSVYENKKRGNTDGFGCHSLKGSTGIEFRGCRSWSNINQNF